MKTDRPGRARGILIAIVTVIWIGCANVSVLAVGPISISGPTMGTTYSVKIGSSVVGVQPLDCISAPASGSPKDYLAKRIAARLTEIDERMSSYKGDSEVSRFNHSRANEWFPVSAETVHVVRRSLEISKQTDGAFDVTVGPLVRLWNFGPGSRLDANIPSDLEIAAAMKLGGYANLEVRPTPPALRKSVEHLEIDLSGIAKGYAVDQVAGVLESENVVDYLVEIGGEIRTSGQRTPGDLAENQWTVGIESPQSNTRSVSTTLPLDDASMASSGDYRNFFEIEGVRYSHTIDPRTGRPVQHSIAAATVIGDDCATADALATALLVLGADAKTFCEKSNVAAILFERTAKSSGAGQFSTHRTSSFPPVNAVDVMSAADRPASFWRLLAASIIIIGIALLAMAVGVIFSNRCIKGSCGGMEGLTDEHGSPLCEGCSTPSAECTTDPSLRQHVDG